MFDLKVINSVLDQLEEERGIPRAKVIEAIEQSLATAYRKEFGKRGQIVRAKFDIGTGSTEFYQVKLVVDDTQVRMDEEDAPEDDEQDEDLTVHFEVPPGSGCGPVAFKQDGFQGFHAAYHLGEFLRGDDFQFRGDGAGDFL